MLFKFLKNLEDKMNEEHKEIIIWFLNIAFIVFMVFLCASYRISKDQEHEIAVIRLTKGCE